MSDNDTDDFTEQFEKELEETLNEDEPDQDTDSTEDTSFSVPWKAVALIAAVLLVGWFFLNRQASSGNRTKDETGGDELPEVERLQ